MREILGENAPALWVGEEENQVKSMHRCATDASSGHMQHKAAATSSSINKATKGDDYKVAKGESENSESLIDFASEAAAPSNSQTNYQNESQVHDYMVSQPDINEKMSAILVNWLIEVHNKFDLMLETLYLTRELG
ncbi:hypothetical protein Dimus_003867 [Dionaea muscipula]